MSKVDKIKNIFKYIRVLKVDEENTDVNLFIDMMVKNYHLSLSNGFTYDDCEEGKVPEVSDKDIEECVSASKMCTWDFYSGEKVLKLEPGTIFKGITEDSVQHTYFVIGNSLDEETNTTIPIWYPINGRSIEVVGKVLKFNFETNKWEFIGVDNVELLTDVIMDQDDPEGYYMVSDLNDNPLELVDDSIDSEPNGLYYVTKDPESDDEEDPDYIIKSLSEITSIMGIIKPFMEGYKKLVKSIEEKCDEATGECECGHEHCHCHHDNEVTTPAYEKDNDQPQQEKQSGDFII